MCAIIAIHVETPYVQLRLQMLDSDFCDLKCFCFQPWCHVSYN